MDIVIKKKKRSWVIVDRELKVIGYSKKSQKDCIKDFGKSMEIFWGVHNERGTVQKVIEKYCSDAIGIWK